MSLMADGSVDAIITDLPYGVLNRKNKAAEWDRRIPFAPLWEQYRRITKPDSPIILFAQGMFTAELIRSQPDLWKYNLVWMKDRVSGHLNANRMPLRQHEDIVVFYKKLPVYHPQMSYKPGTEKIIPEACSKSGRPTTVMAMKPTRSHISDWKWEPNEMKEKEINEPNSTDMNRKGIVTAFSSSSRTAGRAREARKHKRTIKRWNSDFKRTG